MIITVIAVGSILTAYLALVFSRWSGANYQSPAIVSADPWSSCPMSTGWRPVINTGQRLDINEVEARLKTYVTSIGDKFAVAEIMEFSNNFYAIVIEKDTGNGAFEILIDPYSGAITPEPGPNMMWNTKYGMHSRMMGIYAADLNQMVINEDKAKQIALRYLSQSFQGNIGLEEPTRFYGYYTIDYTINGKIHGMLSVNGFTGDVWYHSWHGEFIQEIEVDENE